MDMAVRDAAASGRGQDPAIGDGATRRLARWIADIDDGTMSETAYEWATHATLDWLAVTVAGAAEPLVGMLDAEYGDPSATGTCVLRDARRCGALHAALVNGSAGHALDFDDVSSAMHGHPSVPVLPAALALAQLRGACGRDLLRAVVVGHEVEARVGEMVGISHYARGFHATGTIGTFGAAAAGATLLGLDAERTAAALGLAAAQAAGLKSMFGTMAKPLHAGKAAMNGVMAAQLAARGFTASMEAIEAEQGFAATQADACQPLRLPAGGDTMAVERTLFKYHAACYLTHSTIEAVHALRSRHGLGLEGMEAIEIRVPPGHLRVCDIAEPLTGLQLKFSIRQLAIVALDGVDTATLDLYTDGTAQDARYVRARRRVRVVPVESSQPYAAAVTLVTLDGRRLTAEADVGVPATDAAAQWRRLADKARALVVPVLGEDRCRRLLDAVRGLRRADSLESLTEALR